MLSKKFFDRDACAVAKDLLGKIIFHRVGKLWLSARIIETEAYYLAEKASHASLGFTEKRKALFMPAGTIYMYYARGGDSLNISAHGQGNAVLIKSAYANSDNPKVIQKMQQLNPINGRLRNPKKLCAGQTLLCRSLGLKVSEWDAQQFDKTQFYFAADLQKVDNIICTTRLGIPTGRDEHLLYRFIDADYAAFCTQNPLTKRNAVLNQDYHYLKREQ